MTVIAFLLAFYIQLVSAHFTLEYPYWRGDSHETQWLRPCGGINVTTNRTEWPLDGGSLRAHFGHPWAITYVNLGLGSDDTVIFNISLVPGFNQTGNGTFCFPKLPIPTDKGITAGTNASLQIIQLSALGSALYNCADITFSDNATVLESSQCTNSSGIGEVSLQAATTCNVSDATSTSTSAANSIFALDRIPYELQVVAALAGLFGPWLI